MFEFLYMVANHIAADVALSGEPKQYNYIRNYMGCGGIHADPTTGVIRHSAYTFSGRTR